MDIWAIGVLTYELLVGYAPFEEEMRLATYENILHKEPDYPLTLSLEAIKFIKATLFKVCVCVTRKSSDENIRMHSILLVRAIAAHTSPPFVTRRPGIFSS